MSFVEIERIDGGSDHEDGHFRCSARGLWNKGPLGSQVPHSCKHRARMRLIRLQAPPTKRARAQSALEVRID
jgi:hypothetical protein